MASSNQRICCCPLQPHIQSKDEQILLRHPENQLRNLANTYKNQTQGYAIYDIREFFHDSQIPFRWRGCPYGHMVCCGSCTHKCTQRCPQDVLMRAYMICAHIFNAPTESDKTQRLSKASTAAQMLYSELTSNNPKYFIVAETINELIMSGSTGPVKGEVYERKDNPYRHDYAPIIEHETIPGTPEATRKKVDVETGEVAVMHWPRSGLCPFCLPIGLTNRRRVKRSLQDRSPGY